MSKIEDLFLIIVKIHEKNKYKGLKPVGEKCTQPTKNLHGLHVNHSDHYKTYTAYIKLTQPTQFLY